MKRAISLILALLLTVSLWAPAFASEELPADTPAIDAPAEDVPVIEVAVEPEVPAEPASTAEPEVTPGPEAEAEPETTAELEETEEPEIIVEPEIMAMPEEPTDEPATAEVYSGTCENGTIGWLLEECGTGSDGDAVYKLTFSGSGELTKSYGDEWTDLLWKGISDFDVVTVIINKGISSIGRYAFSFFENLTSISIPNTVKSIGVGAFSHCNSMKEFTIPSSVTSIGEEAFWSCEQLRRVTILNPDCILGADLFGLGCYMDPVLCGYAGSTAYVYANENYREFSCIGVIRSVSGHCGENVMWDLSVGGTLTISGTGEMMYGNTPWEYCSKYIKAVDVLNGVTRIISSAFQDCTNLTRVTVADSVTVIEPGAFDGTPWLEAQGDFLILNDSLFEYLGTGGKVIIPYGVRTIKESAFNNCLSMTSVSIPNSVKVIEATAFCNCSSLTSVTIPNGVTTIGDGAFGSCMALTSVSIPESVTSIGSSAFSFCNALKQIDIPGNTKEIKYQAFAYCPSLNIVTIRNGVAHIGEQAFRDCSNLSSISLPASVTEIDGAAFYDCNKLTSVTILNPSCKIDNGHTTNIGGDPSKGDDKYAFYGTFPQITTLHGYSGSTTETFARENGYSFKSLGAAPVTGTTPTPTPAKKNGILSENGKKYYYVNGIKQKGLITISGKKYYFSVSSGAMLFGLVNTGNHELRYFSFKTGAMLTGVVNTGNGTLRYFLTSDGHMLKNGWISGVGTKRYYADKNGVLYTGFKTIGNKSYYFSVQDAHMMRSGVVNGPNNHQYYVAKDGHALKNGWARGQAVKGKAGYSYYYYLDAAGVVRVTRQLLTGTAIGSLAIPKPSEYQN